MATKWGIVSAGLISADFVTALKLKPESHNVVAVAARSLDSAQDFSNKFGIKEAYGSYEELANNSEIEIVYIGSVHPVHHKIVIMMLNANKHVLCEKPMCMNLRDTQELVDLAKKEKLFLMEGLWSRCLPVYREALKKIKAGEIGDLVHVMSSFGAPISNVPRIKEKSLGGGTVLDLGIYTVQFALWAFGGEKPEKIVASGHLNEHGCDVGFGAVLTFSNNRTAVITSSALGTLPNEGFVIGTKGSVKLCSPMWCATKYQIGSEEFEFPLKAEGKFNFINSAGLLYEADEVRDCLKKGLLECPVAPLSESLLIAEILETINSQLGVTF